MKRRRKTWIENTLKYVEEKESRGIWGEEECFWNKEDYEFDKFIPGDYGLEYNNHPVELRVVYKGEGEYAANELHHIRRQLEVKCNEELINRINDLKSVMVKSFLTTLE